MTNRIARLLKIANTLESEYKGEHESPDSTNGDPIFNVENMYPDIYSNGQQYISIPEDHIGLSIIIKAHNKPNTRVTVYRAVPDFNKDTNTKLKHILSAKYYLQSLKQHQIVKRTNEAEKIIYDLTTKYSIDNYDYDTQQNLMIDDLQKQQNELEKHISKNPKIQKGDWVTPNLAYAKLHGQDNLNNQYKIIQKTVHAKDLYTDGNSLSEWGYDPK